MSNSGSGSVIIKTASADIDGLNECSIVNIALPSTPSKSKNNPLASRGTISQISSHFSLFPDNETFHNFGSSSLCRSVIVLAKSSLGSGILLVPLCFKQLGVIGGSVALFLAALLTFYSLNALQCTVHRLGCSSFPRLVELSAQNNIFLRYSASLFTLFLMIAPIVTCIQLSSQYLQNLLLVPSTTTPATSFFISSTVLKIMFTFLVLLPVANIKRPSVLNMTNILGLLGIGYICILSFPLGIFTDKLTNADLFPRPNIRAVGGAFSTLVFCFSSHFNLPSTSQDLSHPTPSRCRVLLTLSILITALCYFFVGIGGYLMFGNEIGGDFLLESSSNAFIVGRCIMIFVNILSLPLQITPLKTHLHSILTGNRPQYSSTSSPIIGDEKSSRSMRPSILTVLILAVSLILVLLIESPGRLFDLVGGLCGGPVLLSAPIWLLHYSRQQYSFDEPEPTRTGLLHMENITFITGLILLAYGVFSLIIS